MIDGGWLLDIEAERAGSALDDAAIVKEAVEAVTAALKAKGFTFELKVRPFGKKRAKKVQSAETPKDVPVLGTIAIP